MILLRKNNEIVSKLI